MSHHRAGEASPPAAQGWGPALLHHTFTILSNSSSGRTLASSRCASAAATDTLLVWSPPLLQELGHSLTLDEDELLECLYRTVRMLIALGMYLPPGTSALLGSLSGSVLVKAASRAGQAGAVHPDYHKYLAPLKICLTLVLKKQILEKKRKSSSLVILAVLYSGQV